MASVIWELIARHGLEIEDDRPSGGMDQEHLETATEGEDGLGAAVGIANAVILGIICWALAIGFVVAVWWGMR